MAGRTKPPAKSRPGRKRKKDAEGFHLTVSGFGMDNPVVFPDALRQKQKWFRCAAASFRRAGQTKQLPRIISDFNQVLSE
jgi:hypothetical protein